MANPVFGWSNKRTGTIVVMDDGSVHERVGTGWRETTPLPDTPRARELASTLASGARAD